MNYKQNLDILKRSKRLFENSIIILKFFYLIYKQLNGPQINLQTNFYKNVLIKFYQKKI